MLSKYAVPESEKGCGIMSTSTSPSRIRQKLLIPGAFSSRGITLCGYEFAGHRYDWDKRPGWRDYPSSSSQVRTKKIKSIIWVNREMKPALSLHSFFVALSFQAYAWAAGSLVVSQRPCQLCRLWLSQLHIHPLLWWIIFGKSSLWSRYVFLRSCPTSGSVRLHLQRGHIQWEKRGWIIFTVWRRRREHCHTEITRAKKQIWHASLLWDVPSIVFYHVTVHWIKQPRFLFSVACGPLLEMQLCGLTLANKGQ